MMDAIKRARLRSLDLLRGSDIFLLTVIGPILDVIHRKVGLPKGLMAQFVHPDWVGFTVYDMIMPLFIFMCGAALPLALPRRLEADGRAGGRYWRHVFARVALLWGLGLVAQGEILSFDIERISFFNNTLQTIAVGYLAASFVMLIRARWIRRAIPFALAIVYTLFLHLCGDSTPTGNAAVVGETKFLMLFYPDANWHAVAQIRGWHYTWWPTIPMFAFLALVGAGATEIVKGTLAPARKSLVLALAGCGFLALGGVFALFDPVVKHIFTASFTFLATGVCYLLYALYHFVFDVVGVSRGTGLLALFGRHSLLAYMLVESVLARIPRTAVSVVLTGPTDKFGSGLSRFLPLGPFRILETVCLSILLILILHAWDRVGRLKVRG